VPDGGCDQLRILRAAAAISAADGFAALSPERVSGLAGISEETFASHFGGPRAVEGCFLAAVDLLGVEVLLNAGAAARGSSGWAERIRDAIAAMMDQLARDRVLVRVIVLEAPSAGPVAIEGRSALLEKFAGALRNSVPDGSRPSRLIAEAIVGAIWALIHHQVGCGAPGRLPDLSRHATYLALAPIIGHDGAIDAICGADGDLDEYQGIE